MAKLVATEAGGRVVDRCMQMFGGFGVSQRKFPFERWFREMRIRRIGEGPKRSPARTLFAREILGASLRSEWPKWRLSCRNSGK